MTRMTATRYRWSDLLGPWRAVVRDLHQTYGIDLADAALTGRSWPWLAERIVGLLDDPSTRLWRLLHPKT